MSRSGDWRRDSLNRISRWMKDKDLQLKDLCLDEPPQSLTDLSNEDIQSLLDSVDEDEARECGEANEFRESLEGSSEGWD